MKTIDIVLPVYNEEEGIERFYVALWEAVEPLRPRYRFRVIFVLDRSTDRSLEVLTGIAKRSPEVTVLHLSSRFGHQAALVAGIDHSTGDAVIMMDSDFQHPPSLIPLLLDKFEEGYDIVHTVRSYDPDTSAVKRLMSAAFYRIQNALSPVELRQGAADFRLVSRKVADVFRHAVREQNPFLRGLFQWIGFRSTTVAFLSQPRLAGESKYRAGRLLAFAITGILSFSKLPLRLAGLLGLSFSLLGAMYGAVVVYKYMVAGQIPPGYTTLIVSVLLIGGVQLVVLWIMGEYIGSIFDEVKARPLYVVDEIIGGGPR